MTSIMTNRFSTIPSVRKPRALFKRPFRQLTTMDTGLLTPIFLEEVHPGDTHTLKRSKHFGRFSNPTIKPVMDNLQFDTFYFFVPSRLVWDNYHKFLGEKENPTDHNDYAVPKVSMPAGGWPVGSVADYFGVPTKRPVGNINALPFRAHNLIYNEFFRRQDIQSSLTVNKGDATDSPALYNVMRRTKKKDYFTSCLTEPQAGDAVTLPLGTSAPVITGADHTITGSSVPMRMRELSGATNTQAVDVHLAIGGSVHRTSGQDGANLGAGLYPTNLLADLSDATAATVPVWRMAVQLQRFKEALKRGGLRLTEILRSIWGVINPDMRLQRPELLAAYRGNVDLFTVYQTNSSDTVSPQGNITANAVISEITRGFRKSFTEHGYIIGYACVMSDLSYQDGLDRLWTRDTIYDFPIPTFCSIGEQSVLNKELFVTGNPAIDDAVFGYIPRYDELRFGKSKITGKFRSSDPQSLDTYHYAQQFTSTPALDENFILENAPMERILSIIDEPQIILDNYYELESARVITADGVPGYMDHSF